MANIRTQVKDALVTMLQGVVFDEPINGYSTWVSVTRKLKMFNNIDKTVQPALFVVQHFESYENRGFGTPPTRVMNCGLWAFAPSGDDVDGDDILDTMTNAIENLFNPETGMVLFPQFWNSMTNELDFGGLCAYCKIDQRNNLYKRDPGDIDGQALLILPIRIMLP